MSGKVFVLKSETPKKDGWDRGRVKYRYTITNEGTVEADTPAEAEVNAAQAMDDGYGVTTIEVEPLDKERDE